MSWEVGVLRRTLLQDRGGKSWAVIVAKEPKSDFAGKCGAGVCRVRREVSLGQERRLGGQSGEENGN